MSIFAYNYAMEKYKISRKNHKKPNVHLLELVELSSVLSLLVVYSVLSMCSVLVFIAEVMFSGLGWFLVLLVLDKASAAGFAVKWKYIFATSEGLRLMSRKRRPPLLGGLESAALVGKEEFIPKISDLSRERLSLRQSCIYYDLGHCISCSPAKLPESK